MDGAAWSDLYPSTCLAWVALPGAKTPASIAIQVIEVLNPPTTVSAVCSVGPYGTHVEECAFEGLGMCAFLHGCNSAVNPSWVECTLCGQWVHDVCMNVKASTYSASDSFPCGCDILNEGIVPIQSLGWYKSLKVDNLKIDFKELVNTTDKNVSLRRAIFQREGQASVKLGLRVGRFGPFTETFIDELNEKLLGFVDPDKQSLIPDVYMPEVLLEVMKRKETINRLLAELVLIQCKPMDD